MQQLTKSLRLPDLVILGLLFIGLTAPVSLSGVLDATSSGAVAMVYVISTIVMGFTAYSYAKMSQAIPNAGAVFAYASAGIHPKIGFLVGWVILLDYLFIPAVAFLFTGISLNAIIPEVPTWIWTLLAIFATTGMNLVGLKRSMKVTIIFLVCEALVLIAILIIGIHHLAHTGSERALLSPLTGVGHFNWQHIFSGVSIAVLSYLGFDGIATFSEESSGKNTLIGKAMLVCLICAGLFFIFQSYIGVLLSPYSIDQLKQHPELQGKAFYDMVNTRISPSLNYLIALFKAVGCAFSAMMAQASAGRLIFSMARAERLPKTLAKIGKFSGVPTLALLLAAGVNLILALIAATIPDGLSRLVSFVNVGALVAFIMLHVSVIGFFFIKKRLRSTAAWVCYLIIPCVGIVVLLPVLINVNHFAQIAATVWLIIGIIVLYCNKKQALPFS